jgi:hypothetical protein
MAIRIKPQNRGKLHRDLGVPSDKPIPPGKLNEALNSASAATRRRAQFAKNAKSWGK